MRLTSKIIKNYVNNNAFDYADEWIIREEANDLYFQIVDLDRNGLRYMPSSSAIITVTFPNINDDLEFSVSASIVDVADTSIWIASLSDTEIPGSGNVRFELVDGGVSKKWVLTDGIVVEIIENGGC